MIANKTVLVILRQEFATTTNSDSIISSPNAKNGTILTITDEAREVTTMAHLDNNETLAEDFEIIINDFTQNGGDIENAKCNLMGKKPYVQLEKILNKRKIKFDKETWSGTHSYIVEAFYDGRISITNDPEKSRQIITGLLFDEKQDGESRINQAMSNQPINLTKIIRGHQVPSSVLAKPQEAAALNYSNNN